LAPIVNSALAGDIYRWVDDQGQTHLSDHVPAPYQARAQLVGANSSTIISTSSSISSGTSTSATISATTSATTSASSAQSAAQAAANANANPAANTSASTPAAANARASHALRRHGNQTGAAVQVVDTQSSGVPQNCAQLTAAYRASQACFARYRVVGGGVRQEAFSHCTNLVDPSMQCGIAN
jgi:hypothetical protein